MRSNGIDEGLALVCDSLRPIAGYVCSRIPVVLTMMAMMVGRMC
jgi:hypothetical protein